MKNFNIILQITFFCILFFTTGSLAGQNKFKASAVLGITAAQLGGDSLSGYDKLGMTTGLRLGYDFNSKFDIAMELLYAQRGSRQSLGFSDDGENTTVLNYVEIPVYVTLNDWFIENGEYYKVGIFGGLTYAYLITATSSNPLLKDREGEFNDHDLAARFGVYYAFNKNIILRTYYSDSLFKLLEGGLFNTDGLDSFYWTVRLEYNF